MEYFHKRTFTLLLFLLILMSSSCIKEEMYYPIAKNLDHNIIVNYQEFDNGDKSYILKDYGDDPEYALAYKAGEKFFVYEGSSRGIEHPNRMHIVAGNKMLVSAGSVADSISYYLIDTNTYNDFQAPQQIATENNYRFVNYDSYSKQDMFYTTINGSIHYAWWNGNSFEHKKTTIPGSTRLGYISLDPDVGIWGSNKYGLFYHYINENLKSYLTNIFGYMRDTQLGDNGNMFSIVDGDIVVLRKGFEPDYIYTIYNQLSPNLNATSLAVDNEGSIWFSNSNSLYRYFPSINRLEHKSNTPPYISEIYAGELYPSVYLIIEGQLLEIRNNTLFELTIQ